MIPTIEHDPSDYQAATAWLMGRINYERFPGVPYGERVLKLDRMQLLAHRLGDPQLSYPIVHVAGTKGKGSTAAMVAAMLQAQGLRVGLYTSPHLAQIEERFVVDNKLCRPHEFVELVAAVRPLAAALDAESELAGEAGPTFFDLSTAIALLHFQRQQVDAAVLEVGLGGRLDSTNIVHPVVSVVTSISFDHTKQLGNTLGAIAREKAGIIKPGVPVVSGVLPDEPREVVAGVARDQAARLWQLGRDFSFEFHAASSPQGVDRLDYHSQIGDAFPALSGLALGLAGGHQGANAAVALATIDELVRQGWQIEPAACRRGLADVQLPARVERMPGPRPLVVDSAHNPASAAALVETLAPRWPKPWTLVTACSRDKDVAAIVAAWAPHFARVVVTRYLENPRAVDPQELADVWRNASGADVIVCDSPAPALAEAQRLAAPGELVVISGSFFIAAELRPLALQSGRE